MKIFRIIGKTFTWIFYVLITNKERQMYQHAKYRNREVLDVKNDAFGSTYKLGKTLNNQEPERIFLTWKEFRNIHKF